MTPSIYILATQLDDANNLAAQLRNYGYKAKSFVNANVMNNASKGAPPSLIILDEHACNEELQLEPDTPVLFLGDSDNLASRLKASHRGASGFIAKPVNLSVLINRIYQIQTSQNMSSHRVAYLGERAPASEWQLDQFGVHLEHIPISDDLIQQLDTGSYDALVIDGDMPSVSAIELARVCRQHDRLLSLPLLLLTEGSKRPFDEAAQILGIDAVIGLPIRGQDLAAMTQSRIQRAQTLHREFYYLAKREPGSGLYNEHYLLESLNQLLYLEKDIGSRGAVIYLKAPSHLHKHAVIMGNLLRKAVPPPDLSARLDNGDFVVLSYSNDERELDNICTKIRKGLVDHPDIECHVGISLLNANISGASHAIKRAMEAINAPAAVAQPEPEAPVSNWEERWGDRVRHAINNNRFRLVYQPIANLNGIPASYYEVFLRMLDDQGDDILPQEFLAGAQSAELASEIDYWVIDRSAHILNEQSRQIRDKPVLFIKLFPASLDNPTTAKRIKQILDKHSVAGDRFVFQIPQSAINARTTETNALIEALSPLGCQFLIEHFGRHQENDALIHRMPVRYIKLEGDLTQDILLDQEKQARVSEIAKAAKAKNVMSVASLVQDASAMAVLWNCGVDYIQGYFMQEPADIFA